MKTIKNNGKVKGWLINNRYEIYSDGGVVYDTVKALDIPQHIFELRDFLIKEKNNDSKRANKTSRKFR